MSGHSILLGALIGLGIGLERLQKANKNNNTGKADTMGAIKYKRLLNQKRETGIYQHFQADTGGKEEIDYESRIYSTI